MSIKKSSINIGGITCLYEIDEDKKEIVICGFEGSDSRVKIPDFLLADKEYKLTKVGKKAFLGAKFLKEISLPKTVEMFEDWAFAGCNHLERIIIRGDSSNSVIRPTFGKGVFESCEALESILLGYEEEDDFSILLGAAIWRLPAPYLFMDPELGNESWFASWDRSLENYLRQKDDDGYTDRVLCGEEDISYDGIGSVDGELLSDGTNFLIETRKRKCILCFLRLKACLNLSEEKKQIFVEYIKTHNEAWLVLKDELKGKIEYLKLFAELGGIDISKIDDMLIDLGEDYAEGKAYLIRYKQDNSGGNDFFSNLLL